MEALGEFAHASPVLRVCQVRVAGDDRLALRVAPGHLVEEVGERTAARHLHGARIIMRFFGAAKRAGPSSATDGSCPILLT